MTARMHIWSILRSLDVACMDCSSAAGRTEAVKRRGEPMKHRLAAVLLVLLAASATLVTGAAANHGRHHRRARHAGHAGTQARAHLQRYSFSGTLLATPGANATSVSLQVTAGNRPALRAMLGNAQNEVFATSGSEILLWSHGIPHVGSIADLQADQYVTVN